MNKETTRGGNACAAPLNGGRLWILGAFLVGVTGMFTVGPFVHAAESPNVTVFAAASLTNALTDIAKMADEKGIAKVTPSFASSSTLAKQIERGAPADIFLSADKEWMDYLEQRKLIQTGTRSDLLGNALVFIVPADEKGEVKIEKDPDVEKFLKGGRLSLADPDHVPAGKYAKEALTGMGLWAGFGPKLARANDVRGALALVERGECPLGIVYSTDAAISTKVRAAATIPAQYHKPIVYPVGLVTGHDTPAARAFLGFLKSAEAKAVFEKYGFKTR